MECQVALEKMVKLLRMGGLSPPFPSLQGHGGPVKSVVFSPDGQRILTGSWDSTARVWNAANGAVRHILRGHGAPVFSVGFSWTESGSLPAVSTAPLV